MIIKNLIIKLLYRIQHSYLSLIGGILLSTGVSIYVSIFLQKPENIGRFLIFFFVSVLMFISGLLWTILAFKIEIISQSITTAPVDGAKRFEMWTKLLHKEKLIYCFLYAAIILSMISLFIMPLASLF